MIYIHSKADTMLYKQETSSLAPGTVSQQKQTLNKHVHLFERKNNFKN